MIKKIITMVMLLFIYNTSLSQDTMWISGADTTQKDTVVFMTGISKRVHEKINSIRETPLLWDSVPGDLDSYMLWDYRCEDIIVNSLDNQKLHVIFDVYTEYCDCEDEYVNDILQDTDVKKVIKGKKSGYMFTSFILYGNKRFFVLITEIKKKQKILLIEFE